MTKNAFIIFTMALVFMLPIATFASDTVHVNEGSVAVEHEHVEDSHEEEGGGHGAFGKTFLFIAVILIAARLGSLVEKWGQPSVLGELVVGVIIGNLFLAGIMIFEPIKTDTIISFLSELGVVVLLFLIGLESNIKEMKQVGGKALLVAIIGVVVPFVLGAYVIGPWLLPELPSNAHLFLGAALTATSVGITARVFQDLGKLKTSAAQIVLGAAVIDDVMGLIILAVVSALVTLGTVTMGIISLIAGKAILFLIGAIVLGQLIAPHLCKAFSKIHTGVGMKFTIAISLGLIFAYLAGEIGLAPIVGAFAAGLILDPVHFRYFKDPHIVKEVREVISDINGGTKERLEVAMEKHAHRHIEDLIEPLANFVVPIFFVFTGMQVKIATLFDPTIIVTALIITLIAFVGKLASGLVIKGRDKWIVGWGMAPRGEVGLIFAAIGQQLGVVNDEVFSIIVIMVVLTTLLTPLILTHLLKKDTGNIQEQPATA